jgi:hypothetical protein
MSKRKRPARPDPDESTDDAGVKDDMVHVTPDLLAGSPDIFAGRKAEGTAEAEPAASEPAETEPAASEPTEEPVAPTAASTTLSAADEPDAPARPAQAVAVPVAAPPSYVSSPPPPLRARRGGSTTAIGIVFVVIGVFALAVVMSGIDLTESGWPLFIIIPGLALIVAGFLNLGSVATIPGGMLTMLGLVLAYASFSGHWAIWAYAWALVVPFGVGLGVYLQALRERDQRALHTGRTLLFVGFMIFLIGFVLFESILGISGREAFGLVSKGALPLLLILVGAILLFRSMRSRQA